jgi:aminopeptidase N
VGGRDVKLIPVQLNAARVDVPAARGLPAQFVLPNGGGIAYGELHLDAASLAWLTTNLPSIDDELTRGSAWVTLYDAMLDAEVTPDAFLSLALRALPLEKNELNVNRLQAYVRDAYWRYSSPAVRLRLAPRLELALRLGLDAAPTASLKSVWFSALRDMAETRATVEWLTRVWKQEESVPGLTLSETDFIRLAQELAVRDVPGASSILDRQYERTKNPDRKAQFAFVRPSLSVEAGERDAWFASIADVANRRHEPWVLEGLRYLHHPLRAAASEKHIEPGLLLLREIQRTGDIFFPKRWMDATLSGHQSRAAAATVRAFLDRLPPEYPERLRRVILSSSDDLFRAAGNR